MAEKDPKSKDPEQDNLIREIDEELRDERMALLWKSYGTYIISAAVLVVAIVAGYKGWQSYDMSTRTAAAETFLAAANNAADGKNEEAVQAFSKLSGDAPGGYALLARLREAALLAKSGDTAGATTAYAEIAQDSGVDPLYRDLAALFGAQLALNAGKLDAASTQVASLTGDDNPWRYSAREVTALAALAKGDKAKALPLFESLAADNQAPTALRGRARDLSATLKN